MSSHFCIYIKETFYFYILSDSTINRQANAAVETFWSENKTIIESPAPSSTASSFYTDKIKKQNFQAINSNNQIKNSNF
jgi:hypothetical protein